MNGNDSTPNSNSTPNSLISDTTVTQDKIVCNHTVLPIEHFLILTESQKKIIATLCLTVGPFTILENIFILCVIFFTPQLRSRPSYLFITSLATADLMASAVFVYSFVGFHVFEYKDNKHIFLFKLGCVIASFSASVGSLLFTAIDRYICIHRPSEYRAIITKRKAVNCILVMWLIVIFIGLLPLMGWNCCESHNYCSELFPLVDEAYLICWIMLITCLLVLIIHAYIHILWKAHFHSVYMEKQKEGRKGQVKLGHKRMDIKLAKTLGLILIILITFWSPALALMTYDVFAKVSKDTKKVFAFCSMLCLLNSTMNPIVYALRSKDMRRSIVNILSGCKKQQSSLESSMESDGQIKSQIISVCSSCDKYSPVTSENSTSPTMPV
ncbi:cannabinoid receptor 2 [Pristis pectinata]|uniref:cannabinoid receptor 2 n=1 Tax=Pristis pectinata TaxID=685728 RepID=UPI00223C9A84|nr:cannabinoid receptor 2 [Pristis pectinata]